MSFQIVTSEGEELVAVDKVSENGQEVVIVEDGRKFAHLAIDGVYTLTEIVAEATPEWAQTAWAKTADEDERQTETGHTTESVD